MSIFSFNSSLLSCSLLHSFLVFFFSPDCRCPFHALSTNFSYLLFPFLRRLCRYILKSGNQTINSGHCAIGSKFSNTLSTLVIFLWHHYPVTRRWSGLPGREVSEGDSDIINLVTFHLVTHEKENIIHFGTNETGNLFAFGVRDKFPLWPKTDHCINGSPSLFFFWSMSWQTCTLRPISDYFS